MDKYLSHFSAAYEWNIPNINNVFGEQISKKYVDDNIKEYTVIKQGSRYNNEGKITHSCSLRLPYGAIIKRNSQFVASPELVFLELANELDLHRLILLGLQMCSHPAGKPSEAISKKRKLEDFIEKTVGHRGQPNAKQALKFIENSSSSIVESVIFMLLTLPHSFGGFGFKGITMNHEVTLNEEARKVLGQKRCFVDYYLPDKKLAIEYDSITHHGDATTQGKDMIRAMALESQGVDVTRFTTIQLYKKELCDKFIHNLSSRLGIRMRIRAKHFETRHDNLRNLLPSNDDSVLRKNQGEFGSFA